MSTLMQDFRLVLRRLRQAPAFCVGVLVILTLGIGATTALISLLNAIVLRSLPIANPESLIAVSRVNDQQQVRFMPATTVAEFARQQQVFTTVAGYAGGAVFPIEANGALSSMPLEFVDDNYYSVLGIAPAVGRLIDASDRPAAIDAGTVAVISHGFWLRQYGGAASVVGQELRIDGVPFTIIGVTPPGFSGMQAAVAAEIAIPLAGLERLGGRTPNPERPPQASHILARPKAGQTLESARAHVSALWPRIQEATIPVTLTPEQRADTLTLQPIVEPAGRGFSTLRAGVSSTLYMLNGLTALMLLLASINLGGALLARVASREREIAVRAALGASRRQVAQPVLIETLVLSIGGALLAMPLAWWASSYLGAALWAGIPVTLLTTPDTRVLLSAGAVTILTAMLIGVIPAWFASRRATVNGIHAIRTITESRNRWGRPLLVVQIALSLALVFGAGVLGRSLTNLYQANTGFDADDVLIERVNVQPGAYRNLAAAVYYPELVRRVSELPGVQGASLSRQLTYVFNDTTPLQVVARVGDPAPVEVGARVDAVSPDFFRTMRIPLLRGRDVAWTDVAESPTVVVVSSEIATRLFGPQDPIGQRIRVGAIAPLQSAEIIGVVGETALGNLRSPAPVVYRAWLQAGAYGRYPLIQVRATAAGISEAVRDTVESLGTEFVMQSRTVRGQMDNAVGQERVAAFLSALLGILALVMALVGLYGRLTYALTRRTREFGVRIAMGASRTNIAGLIAIDALVVTVSGIALGVPLALALGGVTEAFLYGVTSSDPLTLSAVVASFLAIGTAATIAPAVRAARTNPADFLRSD